MLKKVVILRRRGGFNCEVIGNSHCGSETHIVIKYAVKIQCSTLDKRGFVMAQEDLSDFFQGMKTTRLSCEELAIQCAEILRVKLIKEDIEVHSVAVRLSPPPYLGSAEARISTEDHKD